MTVCSGLRLRGADLCIRRWVKSSRQIKWHENITLLVPLGIDSKTTVPGVLVATLVDDNEPKRDVT